MVENMLAFGTTMKAYDTRVILYSMYPANFIYCLHYFGSKAPYCPLAALSVSLPHTKSVRHLERRMSHHMSAVYDMHDIKHTHTQ
jgi:hypothetical protein